jgi:hypothetical protein
MHNRSTKNRGARAGLRPTPYAFIHNLELRRYKERNDAFHSQNKLFFFRKNQLVSDSGSIKPSMELINKILQKNTEFPSFVRRGDRNGSPRFKQAHTRGKTGSYSPKNKTPPPLHYVWDCWYRLYICPPPLIHTSVQAGKWEIEMSEFWKELQWSGPWEINEVVSSKVLLHS